MLEFETAKRGWQLIAEIIKPKDYQNKFWKLVSRLNDVKTQYNDLVVKQKES